MQKFKNVVVPLDGSPLAEVALPYAEEIAGKAGSDIILLTVLPSEETNEYQNHYNYATKIAESTRRHAEEYIELSENKDVKVGIATRSGNPAEGILDYVNKGYMSLIVMATHGRSGVSRWAMGSVADKVVRATKRQPLLLIRASGAHPDIRDKRTLKKALVPLDGSMESEVVIAYMLEIATDLQMELTLLQVIPKTNHMHADAEAYLHNICSQLEDRGIATRYEVRVGAVADQIIDFANEIASDMVAMSTQGQSAISLRPLGSVAQKVLLGSNLPLLLIKA